MSNLRNTAMKSCNGPARPAPVPTAMSRVDVVQIDIVSGRQASSSERASSSSEARASSRHGTSSRGSSTREASTRQPSRTRPPARIEDVDDLPPLPSPDYQTRRAEACRGCTLVFSVTGVLVGLPHVVRSRAPPDAVGPPLAAQICLYAVALAGLGCLCRLLCGDPGSLKRSDDTCFPLPAAVEKRLSARKSLDGLQNVRTSSGRVYCIRCCIWRPASRDELVHHCSVCQRCVRLHDHHCGVFGRCIAGSAATPWRGTMGVYYGLWVCLVLGLAASVTASVMGAQQPAQTSLE